MDKSEMGKKSRAAGQRFELKVRKDLESKRWIVDKWTNNVELMCSHKQKCCGKLHPAKSNRFNMRSTGFPDFIAFKVKYIIYATENLCEVIAVEVKTNGYLSKTEKDKCRWYLLSNIFSKIFIASKGDKKIVYKEFEASKNRSHGLQTSHERRKKK
ncbi:hypothetical protein LCGC14_2934140 [marine sediment metagenome]|uniref:VRR-NUC domain-containing protein n=1 Tax=marine sediment metagenome TaxID=412755 RepID=A0A0F8XJX8_9ZZZZ